MQQPYHIQEFTFGGQALQLYVPDETFIREKYELDRKAGLQPLFPYWAKIWPAAIALCHYIRSHPELVKNKVVVELAAGLGLPSLLAATFAKKVISSDHAEEALPFIRGSAGLNRISNLETQLIDWQHYPSNLHADMVLLSDINYDPAQFEILNQLLLSLLNKGTVIVLCTPQRITGKPFIEGLLPYCKTKQTGYVETGREKAEMFIMQLEKRI